MLVNFITELVHINFAQSRIPALVCSPQSEWGNRGNVPSIPKFSG